MVAVRTAWMKIAQGQSNVALVGAAQNAPRLDLLILHECGGYNLREEFSPVWRWDRRGFALGSGAAFLVFESRDHAESRCAIPYAIISGVTSTQSDRRAAGAITEALRKDASFGFGTLGHGFGPAHLLIPIPQTAAQRPVILSASSRTVRCNAFISWGIAQCRRCD